MELVYRRIWILGFVLCLGLTQAWAGNNWLDQGKDLLKSYGSGGESASVLSESEIGSGLKQALEKGALAVVSQLGATDGFNMDKMVRIPLPENLSMVTSLLDKAGMGSYTDEVELKLNRAAEAAVPKTRDLFLDAISQMNIQDAQSILNGPDDGATQYFKKKMSPGLVKAMTPVIESSLESVGAVQAYDQMMAQYKTLPFVPDVKGDLTAHAVEKAMDGIFYYLAKEEKAIRENPAKRTTELLQRVFK